MSNKVILAILDGFGLRNDNFGNAVAQANTPNYDEYLKKYSSSKLYADGEHVGLPDGQMGNSEVGHLNIGAGRTVYQSLVLLNKEIDNGNFFKNEEYLNAINHAKKNNSALHIMGLLSSGGVHSHIKHILAMVKMAKENQLEKIYIHAFLDGRDVDPKSAKEFLAPVLELVDNKTTFLASVSGRYYSMDRDKRWDRVEKAYNAVITAENSPIISDVMEYVDAQYDAEIYDEFIEPAIIEGYEGAKDGDSFVFMNFRPDRAMQLAGVLTNANYNPQPEDNPVMKPTFRPSNIYFVATMKYSDDVIGKIAYKPQKIENTLGDVLSVNNKKQLRIAETEKYPHVTFFFDGGVDKEIEGSRRILINSPKVATYDLQPEMSAYEVTDSLIGELNKDDLDVVILNFANPDMVGHSGKLDATIKAIEVVDECLGKVVEKGQEKGFSILVTADHGNADQVLNEDGSPNTAHTTNQVPYVLIDKELELKDEEGALCDIAPTILDILNIDKPKEMTGKSLIKRN